MSLRGALGLRGAEVVRILEEAFLKIRKLVNFPQILVDSHQILV